MQKKVCLFLSASLFLFLSLHAQNAKITGKVISSKTGEVLIGATISIGGDIKPRQSDQNGHFSFSGLKKGKYSIVCSYVS